MPIPASRLRTILKKGKFIYMPAVIDPMGGRIAEQIGFKAVYTGGYATGSSLTVTEPLLTMTEQVEFAKRIANACTIPLVCDAGAGFGEPLHAMRTVKEFIAAGVAGIHIEDQLYPKRAHYHKYVAHTVSVKEFVDKIKLACRARDAIDKNFIIIARSDTCRFEGLGKAIKRINKAAAVGADLGLVFPRNHKEAVAAPKKSKLPLIWVQSRGNRDGRPLYNLKQLQAMGYMGCIDAQIHIGISCYYLKQALTEIKRTGDYSGLTPDEWIQTRQEIEDLCGLEAHYAVEEDTVEKKKWGKK
ncbi:MAG: isocitrate lyase/PEP mutase family protein [Desulfobacterales bacterium]|nr:isocitrate lyase/PEP mutase family protein [Desulfobacterales bacterium]